MKKIILLSVLLTFVLNSYGQKVKYNEIKTLLESKQDEKALPLLVKYYNQNIVDGKWSSKAILMEMDNMFSASENLARIYENKANVAKSAIFADSSILWFNAMIKDDHPQKSVVNQKIQILEKNKKNWQEEVAANTNRINREKADELKKIKNDSIMANLKLQMEDKAKNQIKYRELNSGVNDPMVVAKKYAEAYIKGDIETLILHGYNDSVAGKVGILDKQSIAFYKANKVSYDKAWKEEVLRKKINLRLTQDFNKMDYKLAEKIVGGERGQAADDVTKPKVVSDFEDENHVRIYSIMSYNSSSESCKGLPANSSGCLWDIDMQLIKVKGKWKVKELQD